MLTGSLPRPPLASLSASMTLLIMGMRPPPKCKGRASSSFAAAVPSSLQHAAWRQSLLCCQASLTAVTNPCGLGHGHPWMTAYLLEILQGSEAHCSLYLSGPEGVKNGLGEAKQWARLCAWADSLTSAPVLFPFGEPSRAELSEPIHPDCMHVTRQEGPSGLGMEALSDCQMYRGLAPTVCTETLSAHALQMLCCRHSGQVEKCESARTLLSIMAPMMLCR